MFIRQVWDWTNRRGSSLCQINIHPIRIGSNYSLCIFIVSNQNSFRKYGIELVIMDLYHFKSIFIPKDWLNQSPKMFIVLKQYLSQKYRIEQITMNFSCVKSKFILQIMDWLNHHRPLICQIEILNWSPCGVSDFGTSCHYRPAYHGWINSSNSIWKRRKTVMSWENNFRHHASTIDFSSDRICQEVDQHARGK